MTDHPATSATAETFRERLRTPYWWYVAAIGIACLLAGEFSVLLRGWLVYVPFVVVIALCMLVVLRLSSGSVSLTGNTLTAGDRSIDVARVSAAIRLSPTELRRLVGRHGDPAAYTFIRSWIGPGAQLVLEPAVTDETDTVPYWVVTSRHPDRLLAALAERGVPVR